MKKHLLIITSALTLSLVSMFSTSSRVSAQAPNAQQLCQQKCINAPNPGQCLAACPASVNGQGGGITNPAIPVDLGGNPDQANSGATFSKYFIIVWRAIIVVGTLAMLFSFVNGALEWITAGGEQAKVSHARQKMTEGVVGLAILVGSFVIIEYIGLLFHFDVLKITFPTP